ncbi:MAG: hypothetical protein H7Z12_06125 [Rhodospirillaceae bacterium]|nr:hypothetical protein [Rhodospirillales bacterium]
MRQQPPPSTLTQADGQAAPAWIKVDAATGTISGDPPPGFTGEVVLNVLVKNADGSEVVKQIVVKVDGKQTGERSGKDRQAAAKPSLGAQLGNTGRIAFVAQRQALVDAVRG